MNEERNKFVEKQQKIEGLTIVPNDEAVLLEKALGISFGDTKPAKIKMDAAYKQRMIQEVTAGKNILQKGLALIGQKFARKDTAAVYSSEWDAYVCLDSDRKGNEHHEERERFDGLHENMHGWIERQNETWTNMTEEALMIVIDSLHNSERPDKEAITQAIEKFLLAKIMSEGVCDFAAVYTGLHSDEITDKKIYLNEHIMHTHSSMGDREIETEELGLYDFDEQSFLIEVHNLLLTRDKIVDAIISKRSLMALMALQKTKSIWYDLGYKLMQVIVEAGEEEGKTVNEMFARIITKPFTKLNEIIDVGQLEKHYAQSQIQT